MQFVEFHEIIEERSQINDNWSEGIDMIWKKMTDIFSADIDKTILFLDECTADEFIWLSEIFEDIAEKTQSRKFISVLRKTAEKYPEETQKYNIIGFVDCAEKFLE